MLRKLDKDLSLRLTQKAKALGFTVTPLLEAAHALATFELNPKLIGDEELNHVTLFPTM